MIRLTQAAKSYYDGSRVGVIWHWSHALHYLHLFLSVVLFSFSIVIDGERGNRPRIYSLEQLLQEAVSSPCSTKHFFVCSSGSLNTVFLFNILLTLFASPLPSIVFCSSTNPASIHCLSLNLLNKYEHMEVWIFRFVSVKLHDCPLNPSACGWHNPTNSWIHWHLGREQGLCTSVAFKVIELFKMLRQHALECSYCLLQRVTFVPFLFSETMLVYMK